MIGLILIGVLLGITESMFVKNGTTNYHKREIKTTLKMFGIYFGIFVLGILLTYFGTIN